MNGIGMVIAYLADGTPCGTLDYRVMYDETKPDRPPLGLVDFAAHEEAGGEMLDVWRMHGRDGDVPWGAKGSKVWPEWIGREIFDFTVELEGPPGGRRIKALVHKRSGYRRERATVEAAIQARLDEKAAEAIELGNVLRAAIAAVDANGARLPTPTPAAADIRDLVGGPHRPLLIDVDGRTIPRTTPLVNVPLIASLTFLRP